MAKKTLDVDARSITYTREPQTKPSTLCVRYSPPFSGIVFNQPCTSVEQAGKLCEWFRSMKVKADVVLD